LSGNGAASGVISGGIYGLRIVGSAVTFGAEVLDVKLTSPRFL